MKKECKIHGLTEHFTRPDSGVRCKKCASASVATRRRKLKLLAVEYKGGKCIRCGYDKCVDALDFHHTDPSQKEFRIASGNTPSWTRMQTELDKCILLCANCHREEHATDG